MGFVPYAATLHLKALDWRLTIVIKRMKYVASFVQAATMALAGSKMNLNFSD
jgi:hypothetical protein